MKRKLFTIASLVSMPLLLSSCLLIAPYNDQVMSSRSADIPFQAWSVRPNATLKVECMPTNRFGPIRSSHGSWTQVATLSGSSDATRDLFGSTRYSASKLINLPQSCWYLNAGLGWYYTSLRVLHDNYIGEDTFQYLTLDRDGINCVASSVSTSGNQVQWMTDGCQHKYPGTTTPIKFVVIRTRS